MVLLATGHINVNTSSAAHMGLDLVAALMPRSGAILQRQQGVERTTVALTLQPPTLLQPDTSDTP
jgi:hypothetical protein